MVIRRITDTPMRRRKICFFDEDPPKDAIAELKEYEVCSIDASIIESVENLSDVAAVILLQNSDKPTLIEQPLSHDVKTLLCHDCRVFVVPARVGKSAGINRKIIVNSIVQNLLPSSGLTSDEMKLHSNLSIHDADLTPTVHIIDDDRTPWTDIRNILHGCPPGNPPYLHLEINPASKSVEIVNSTDEEKVLVQRAFYDCKSVELRRQQEGRSGVYTYRVAAVRRSTGENRFFRDTQPYHYFVKIGERTLIAKEYSAYRDISLEHIPFHLGPRLQLNRCVLGAEKGLIVCDYVSDSENLRDCARDGRAIPVIASLFNTTLRSWLDGSSKSGKCLWDFLQDRMPKDIPEPRKELIEQIDEFVCPADLARLLEQKGNSPTHIGVTHGDLHSLNVLVRGTDAILIDFDKVERNQPLLLDFASLEAGLFVDGFLDERRSREALLNSIECYYRPKYLINHKQIKYPPSNDSAWFLGCIRQIRLQAREIELFEGQYALTLAVELAKKAGKELPSEQIESSKSKLNVDDLRSLAYILCQRILTAT